jgi:O-acetyl-ADP-ribose deacetylase (regulator of RNase III)
VGPVYGDGEHGEAQTLASCYRECIRLADDHAIKSLAFPSISTGAYGYPVAQAASVAVVATLEALSLAHHLRLVRFVLFDSGTREAYIKAAETLHGSNPSSPYKLEKSA